MKTYHDIESDGGSNVEQQVFSAAQKTAARMASVGSVVAIMSGKGGVGKSTVAVQLADAFARQGQRVGLVDADINGSSVAALMGVAGSMAGSGPDGVTPVQAKSGVKVMSLDFMRDDVAEPIVWEGPQRDTYVWRGMMEMHAVREMLSDTEWGDLDVLVIDLPPGSERLPHLLDVLPRLDGCVVVTTPGAVPALVVERSVRAATELLNTRILGLVINMDGYRCPHCNDVLPLFGDADRTYDLPVLERIAFDPRLSVGRAEGHPGFANLAATIEGLLKRHEARPA